MHAYIRTHTPYIHGYRASCTRRCREELGFWSFGADEADREQEEEDDDDDDEEEEVSPRSIRSDLYSPEALSDFAVSHTAADEIARRRCPSVISVLASLLERVVARNERLFPPSSARSSSPPEKRYASFYGIRVPTISIEEYLERIFKYANCSPSCFVVAYAYIDRLVQHQPQLRINSLNVHRVLITSILVSAKFLDDL
jgi:hypothetical protein